MKFFRALSRTACCLASLFLATSHADVVTDWNIKANDFVAAAKVSPLAANRTMAIVNVAVFDAVNAISGRYPKSGRLDANAAADASIDAAVAAATRGTLGKVLPQVQKDVDAAYVAALANVAEGAAKTAGIAIGEKAAAAILAMCANDGAMAPDTYVPATTPGVYVLTGTPAAPHWGRRKPWVMTSGDQFRPAAPPALGSDVWARDYNEVKTLGGKSSTQRSAAQTDIARFWEATLTSLYYPLARTVALQTGREVTQNARLMAVVGMAMDDAVIAVFDAKYAYGFWRPVTAIRNGDKDGNNATDVDTAWTPFIDTPPHPEYPCGHCIVASALATVLQAEMGSVTTLNFSSTSPSLPGATRSWTNLSEFAQEVQNARVYDGVHFRNSVEVAASMGRKVGELAAAQWLR
jgi:hypothetical protein